MPTYESATFNIVGFNLLAHKAELDPTLEIIRNQALERSRLNAPIDTGEFRDSLYVDISLTPNAITFNFGSTLPDRVFRLHEDIYRLGPRSKVQAGTNEGGVGNKFFTRVIDFWAEKWADLIELQIIDIVTRRIQ